MRIVCMGDSTMQYNDCTTFPQTGWPQALDRFLPAGTEILDFAKNGRSTKSYIDEGLFDKALESVEKGSFVLIEFGHNDEKLQDPARGTTAFGSYQENLRYFIKKIQEKSAYPIILTSIARRKFNEDNKTLALTHGEYPKAALAVAAEFNIPGIDMDELTRHGLEKAGVKRSRSFFMNFDAGIYGNYPDGKEDNTHLRFDGAFFVADIAATALAALAEKWSDYKSLSESIIIQDKSMVEKLASLPEEP